MDSLYVVMPAYNEEANIETVVRAWYPVLQGKSEASRLVIADQGSTDSTHEILMKLKEEMPQLDIIDNTGKQHGPKVLALYAYAISQGADYIFQTDSDGQTDPDEFEPFWKNRGRYEAILGNRTVRGDGFSRKMVEKVVTTLLFIFFGVRVPDANAPFRLMRADLVAKYIDRLDKDYNIPNIMFTTYFAYYKHNIRFKIVSFKPRQGGMNSIDIKKIVKIGIKAVQDFVKLRREM